MKHCFGFLRWMYTDLCTPFSINPYRHMLSCAITTCRWSWLVLCPLLVTTSGYTFLKFPSRCSSGGRTWLGGEAGQSDPVQRPGHQSTAGGDPGRTDEGYTRPGLPGCQTEQTILQHTLLPEPPKWSGNPRAPHKQTPAQAHWERRRVQARFR